MKITTNDQPEFVQLGDDALNGLGIGIVEQLIASTLIDNFARNSLQTDLDVHMAIEQIAMSLDGRDADDEAPYGSNLDALYQMGVIDIDAVAQAVAAILADEAKRP